MSWFIHSGHQKWKNEPRNHAESGTKNQSSPDIDTFEAATETGKQIKFTESSRISSPNPDSISGWTWRSAKVTKAPCRLPPFSGCREIFDHNTLRYTLSRATAGKRGETKRFSVDICERVELIVMRRLLRARLEKFSLTDTKKSIKRCHVCVCCGASKWWRRQHNWKASSLVLTAQVAATDDHRL